MTRILYNLNRNNHVNGYYLTLNLITSGQVDPCQVAVISVRLSPPYIYLNSASPHLYYSLLPRRSCTLAPSGRPACDGTSDIHWTSCQVDWSTWLTHLFCYILGKVGQPCWPAVKYLLSHELSWLESSQLLPSGKPSSPWTMSHGRWTLFTDTR